MLLHRVAGKDRGVDSVDSPKLRLGVGQSHSLNPRSIFAHLFGVDAPFLFLKNAIVNSDGSPVWLLLEFRREIQTRD
jgi:hypothetical protein